MTVPERARSVLMISAIATLALYVIPFGDFIAYPLLLISTVFHELGHGFTALLVGGGFSKLEIYANGGGLAYTTEHGGAASAAVIAGGLVGPAIGAMLCFVAARRPLAARISLAAIGAVLVAAEILYVRTAFGLVFVAALAAVCLGIAARAKTQTSQLALGFLAVQLALSVFSRGGYLFTKTAGGLGDNVSDVAQMAEVLGGTYWMWGLVCGAISIVCLVAGGWLMVRGGRRTPVTPAR